jgi:phosphoribosylformimino-5-aminoimidazole carboxamide ribotide isomerase
MMRILPPVRIVGVIDLQQGAAVHARGGRRSAYRPVAVPGPSRERAGDVSALARFYRDTAGLADVYVADLDAIAGGAWHDDAIRSIAATASHLWLDAGIATATDAERAWRLGAHRIVIGLETLPAFDALAAIADAVGGNRVVLSLDLRDGRTVASRGALPEGVSAADAAAEAIDCGARALVVLDLARVGSAGGCDLDTLRAVRRVAPDAALFAGGGVRNADDLRLLSEAGCDGALVATALLSGALTMPVTEP